MENKTALKKLIAIYGAGKEAQSAMDSEMLLESVLNDLLDVINLFVDELSNE